MPTNAPGPEGHALQNFIERQRDPLAILVRLRQEYGPVFEFRALNMHALTLAEPELVGEVLVHKAKSFHKTPMLKHGAAVLGHTSVLIIEEEDHARLRRLIQPAFHRKRIAGYADIVERRTKAWQESWADGEVRDFHVEMVALTRGIVTEALFGDSVDDSAEEIAEAMTVVSHSFARASVPFSDLLLKLPVPGNREIRAALETIETTIMDLVKRGRETGRDEGDLMSMLLAAQDTEGGSKPLTNEEVHDQVATLFIAGHETTSNALTFSWYLLAKHPEMQERLAAEAAAVAGDGPLTMESVPALTYTRAVMSEAMRLYPPAWSVGREAIEDVTIGDYTAEKGMIVFVPPYLVHHDERWWPEPERFDPERWLTEEKTDRPRFAYYPFGAGARVCAGEQFAWMEGILILAGIARRWKLSLCDETDDPPALQPSATLSTKNGMKLRISPR